MELNSPKLKTDANILKIEDKIENSETVEAPVLKEVDEAIRMLNIGRCRQHLGQYPKTQTTGCRQGLICHVRKSGLVDNGPKTGHSRDHYPC